MKKEAPRVTVAIPCFNGERCLAESLESVLSQEHGEIEVVVFDDGSTDRSVEIARGFDDPRLTVRQNPSRLGIGANWNQGLRYGTGPYVVIHHQDDVMAPGSIGRKAAFMEAHPAAGFVYSRIEAIDGEGRALPGQEHWFSNGLFDRDRLLESMPFFMALLLGKNLVCCPSVMMRRSAALDVGGFSEEMGFTLDWEMWLRMAAAHPVGYVDAVTVRYRCHGGQETHRHLDRLPEHSYRARISAVRRSAERLGAWRPVEILEEMVEIVRQIEERSPQPRGLEILAPLRGELPPEFAGDPEISGAIGAIRHPADQVRALCREVKRLDADREALRGRVKEYEESASFRLGRALLAPMRWIRRTRDQKHWGREAN